MRTLARTIALAVAVMCIGVAPAQALDFPDAHAAENSTAIVGPDAQTIGPASPYGSPVTMTGGTGFLFYASVTLHDVTSTSPEDLDVVLESPDGVRTVLMSDAGGAATDLSHAEIEMDTLSNTDMPTPGLVSGFHYRPTNIDHQPKCSGRPSSDTDDTFAPPVGVPPSALGFDTFGRWAVNGTWKLYVMDDCKQDVQRIDGGWTLQVVTEPDFGTSIPGTGTKGTAAVYPVDIPVAGQGTQITKVTAELDGFNHTQTRDLDFLLVGPTGASTVLMSDAGEGKLEDVDGGFVFEDGRPAMPKTSALGSAVLYRPTDYDDVPGDSDDFRAPAPPPPYGTAMSAFNGTNPNGTWKLYAVDDASIDVGGIEGARLNITSTTPEGVSQTTTTKVVAKATPKTTAKVLASVGAKDLKLGKVVKAGGFTVPVKVNQAAGFVAQALVPSPLAKSLKLPPNGKAFTSAKRKPKPAIVATGSARAGKAGTIKLKLKLTRKARRALAKRNKSVSLQLRTRVTPRSGKRRLVKSTVKLKR